MAPTELTRRAALAGTGAAAACLASAGRSATASVPENPAMKGRIKQSLVYWCFNMTGDQWDLERTCRVATQLGCPSIELAGPETWPTLRKHGLICALAPNGMPGAPFMRGLNNPAYQPEVIARTTEMIDACATAGFPGVIAFTGYRWRDADDPRSGEIPPEEGADNCVQALGQLARHAEKKGVTINLEHLNTRDDTHPMKGHPGYQGDDLDYVANIVRRVGSPRVRLLFDFYHVQVMNGDLLRRVEQCKDVIGHIHVAGCPGRGELDDSQEINFPPLMRKLLDIGYEGYVGQEFIPTRDALAGLTQAVKLCDV